MSADVLPGGAARPSAPRPSLPRPVLLGAGAAVVVAAVAGVLLTRGGGTSTPHGKASAVLVTSGPACDLTVGSRAALCTPPAGDTLTRLTCVDGSTLLVAEGAGSEDLVYGVPGHAWLDSSSASYAKAYFGCTGGGYVIPAGLGGS